MEAAATRFSRDHRNEGQESAVRNTTTGVLATQSLSWQRWVPILILAMLGVLIPMTPAQAASPACPTSIPSAGYKDLGGLSAETIAAIDCITHYGIAQGTTATVFDPMAVVPRWQMALFLVRTAEDLGISLPSGANQGFNDISGLSVQAQTAINQLVQLGVTRGVSSQQFAPFDAMPRWQMALFITRLHSRAGLALPSGDNQGFIDTPGLSNEAWLAINQLSQLGISVGIGSNRFDPYGLVPRWQMALFISRHLGISSARPFIVSISPNVLGTPTSTSVQLTIQVRRADGTAVSGRLVDVFVGSLDSAKRCVLDSDASINGGDAATSTNCKLDSSDPKTNSNGNVTVNVTHNGTIETDTVYAWVGNTGDTFDADDVLAYGTAQIQWTAPIGKLVVDDVSMRFGAQAQVAARLQTSSGQAVAAPGQRIVFRVTRDGAQIITQAVNTGSDGVATLVYTGPNDPTSGDDPAKVDSVVAFWDKDSDGVDDGAAEFDDTATVTWDDDLPRKDVVSLTQTSASSLAGQPVTVLLTVTDKFGVGYNGAKVDLKVTGANPTTRSANTGSGGKVQFTYTPSVSGIDTIDATVDLDADGVIEPEDFEFGEVTDLTHYSVANAPNLTDGTHTFDVIGVDPGANTIDVIELGSGNLYRLKYDSSNDLFSVDGNGRNLDQFESSLTALALPKNDGPGGVELKTNTYTTTQSGSSTFILKTK